MEATMSYQAGKPIISDSEYDELKGALRKKNSRVVQQVALRTCNARLAKSIGSGFLPRLPSELLLMM